MIRFLLPVTLLAFGACQVPNQGNDAIASQASLEVSEDCSGSDCSSEVTAASSECTEGQSECCAEKAAAAATAAAASESCAMKAAGVCEDGGECAMQAAGNTECSEMGTKECPMEKATAAAMDPCEGMDPAACEAMKAECEGMEAACETKSECSNEEAPASVKTGATQASAVKKEASACCSSKLAEPSS